MVRPGTSPLPRAAAVSASITVSPKAASRPGASVMGQPYAAPPPPGRPRSHNRTKRYADQNERDYQAFTEAIRSGRMEAREGI